MLQCVRFRKHRLGYHHRYRCPRRAARLQSGVGTSVLRAAVLVLVLVVLLTLLLTLLLALLLVVVMLLCLPKMLAY